MPNAKVVGLCDVDTNQLETAAEEVNDLTGNKPQVFTDFRELLEKQQIDIAIVATPDHWHALNTIAALESGAHVFVKSPRGTPWARAQRSSRPRGKPNATCRSDFIDGSARTSVGSTKQPS